MLTINEIFLSIQGESTFAGRPCLFVRLTACDLRCSWCDTPHAFYEGRRMTLGDVLAEVDRFGCSLVEITGGEPLLQEEVYPLMDALVERGSTVLLETGGHRDASGVNPCVHRILDVKCPGSGESDRNWWSNLDRLRSIDEVKFVILDRADYEWARAVVVERGLERLCGAVLFSPVHGVLDLKALAEWVLADRLPVRVQVQLHKYIWGADARGV